MRPTPHDREFGRVCFCPACVRLSRASWLARGDVLAFVIVFAMAAIALAVAR